MDTYPKKYILRKSHLKMENMSQSNFLSYRKPILIILGKYIRLYKPSKIRYRLTTLTLSQGHWGHLKSQIKVKFPKKGIKTLIIGCISEAILPTDFILGTKVQPKKAHSMTQVPMTLTLGQGHRSRSNFSKMGKKPKNWRYLGCYFTYRLHTWYQGTTL